MMPSASRAATETPTVTRGWSAAPAPIRAGSASSSSSATRSTAARDAAVDRPPPLTPAAGPRPSRSAAMPARAIARAPIARTSAQSNPFGRSLRTASRSLPSAPTSGRSLPRSSPTLVTDVPT